MQALEALEGFKEAAHWQWVYAPFSTRKLAEEDKNGMLVALYALAIVLACPLQLPVMLLMLQVLRWCPQAQSGVLTAPMAAKL